MRSLIGMLLETRSAVVAYKRLSSGRPYPDRVQRTAFRHDETGFDQPEGCNYQATPTGPEESEALHYNHKRPHSSLDYMTPAEFAAQLEPAIVVSVASAPDGATAFDHSTKGWLEMNRKMITALS